MFKTGYQIHGYQQWLVDNVATILDADLAIGSAGLLRGGAVAWVQVELADTLTVENVDYRPFLTAATSLDGSLARPAPKSSSATTPSPPPSTPPARA